LGVKLRQALLNYHPDSLRNHRTIPPPAPHGQEGVAALNLRPSSLREQAQRLDHVQGVTFRLLIQPLVEPPLELKPNEKRPG
jgi:hypothetical protein